MPSAVSMPSCTLACSSSSRSISSTSGPSPIRVLISSNRARSARIGATAVSTFPRTSRLGSSIGSWGRYPILIPDAGRTDPL